MGLGFARTVCVYRKYYGWKVASYIDVVFYVTIALTAIIMNLVFNGLYLVPAPNPSRYG